MIYMDDILNLRDGVYSFTIDNCRPLTKSIVHNDLPIYMTFNLFTDYMQFKYNIINTALTDFGIIIANRLLTIPGIINISFENKRIDVRIATSFNWNIIQVYILNILNNDIERIKNHCNTLRENNNYIELTNSYNYNLYRNELICNTAFLLAEKGCNVLTYNPVVNCIYNNYKLVTRRGKKMMNSLVEFQSFSQHIFKVQFYAYDMHITYSNTLQRNNNAFFEWRRDISSYLNNVVAGF